MNKMLKGQKKHIDKEQGKIKHEAPGSVNYRATQNKNNIGTTALEQSLERLRKSILMERGMMFSVFIPSFIHSNILEIPRNKSPHFCIGMIRCFFLRSYLHSFFHVPYSFILACFHLLSILGLFIHVYLRLLVITNLSFFLFFILPSFVLPFFLFCPLFVHS